MTPLLERLECAYQSTLAALLAERTPEGHWVGELSTSALSTATTVSALALVQKATTGHGSFHALLAGGLNWLASNQNADGGWGDTVKSFSNISTTMLCRAAFHLSGTVAAHEDTLRRCEDWLHDHHGKTPEELAESVRARYGKDRTFSVPILMTQRTGRPRLVAKCPHCRSSWRAFRSRGFASCAFPWSATPCRRSSLSGKRCIIIGHRGIH